MDDPVILIIAAVVLLFSVAVLGLSVWAMLIFVRHRWKLAKISIKRMEQLVQPDQYGRLPVPEKFLHDPVFAVRVLETHNASFFSNVRSYRTESRAEHPALLTDQQPATIDVKPAESLPSFWQLYQNRQLPQSGLLLGFSIDDEHQIVDALNFVTAIGKRRLLGHDADRTPVVLVVDETSALLSRSTTAAALTDALGQITQETGKVGIYAICIGQDFNGQIFDTAVRNAFVSMFTMRTRKETARIQSGSKDFGRKAETLRIGQCVWMNPSGDVIRIAVPNCTQDDLLRVSETISTIPALPLVNHGSAIGSGHGSAIGSDNKQTELDAKAANAIDMFLQGSSNSDIVAQLWGATSGDKKMKALQELNTILRTHMINLKGSVNHG